MALPVRVQQQRAADPLALARNDFNRMLSQLFGGRRLFNDEDDANVLAALGSYGVDIREDNDHICVIADLPGFRKEDVDISLENGTLTIVAERREEITEPPPGQQQQRQPRQSQQPGQQGQQGQEQAPAGQQQELRATSQQGGEYLLRERRIQRFVRSFTLPPNIDERNVQAKLENGVLTIVLNKKEESKPKHVQVS